MTQVRRAAVQRQRQKVGQAPAAQCLTASTHAANYEFEPMRRRSALARVVVGITAACFISLVFVSAGHVHGGATSNALGAECPLCAVGHARVDIESAGPVLFGLALIAWLKPQSLVRAPLRHSPDQPSQRAPPVR